MNFSSHVRHNLRDNEGNHSGEGKTEDLTAQGLVRQPCGYLANIIKLHNAPRDNTATHYASCLYNIILDVKANKYEFHQKAELKQ